MRTLALCLLLLFGCGCKPEPKGYVFALGHRTPPISGRRTLWIDGGMEQIKWSLGNTDTVWIVDPKMPLGDWRIGYVARTDSVLHVLPSDR